MALVRAASRSRRGGPAGEVRCDPCAHEQGGGSSVLWPRAARVGGVVADRGTQAKVEGRGSRVEGQSWTWIDVDPQPSTLNLQPCVLADCGIDRPRLFDRLVDAGGSAPSRLQFLSRSGSLRHRHDTGRRSAGRSRVGGPRRAARSTRSSCGDRPRVLVDVRRLVARQPDGHERRDGFATAGLLSRGQRGPQVVARRIVFAPAVLSRPERRQPTGCLVPARLSGDLADRVRRSEVLGSRDAEAHERRTAHRCGGRVLAMVARVGRHACAEFPSAR